MTYLKQLPLLVGLIMAQAQAANTDFYSGTETSSTVTHALKDGSGTGSGTWIMDPKTKEITITNKQTSKVGSIAKVTTEEKITIAADRQEGKEKFIECKNNGGWINGCNAITPGKVIIVKDVKVRNMPKGAEEITVTTVTPTGFGGDATTIATFHLTSGDQ